MKNKGYRGAIGWAVLLLSFFIQVAYGQGTGDFTVLGSGNYSFNAAAFGTIAGNIPAGRTGNVGYKVSYDTNGGTGTVADTYHAAGTEIDLPFTTNLSKKGYTFLGWNTTNDATTALAKYTVKEGTNTLYAVWKANEVELISDGYVGISGTVGKAFSQADLSSKVTNAQDVLGVTFAVKTGDALPDGFSLAEEGKLTGAGILTTAMTGKVVYVIITPRNGARLRSFRWPSIS